MSSDGQFPVVHFAEELFYASSFPESLYPA